MRQQSSQLVEYIINLFKLGYMFRSERTVIRPVYKNLVYEWMDKAFEISEHINAFQDLEGFIHPLINQVLVHRPDDCPFGPKHVA
jgi:hypothetical protein